MNSPIDLKSIQVGDWVRFYLNGKFVIGVVNYITSNLVDGIEVNTDVGTTSHVYEVRSNNKIKR